MHKSISLQAHLYTTATCSTAPHWHRKFDNGPRYNRLLLCPALHEDSAEVGVGDAATPHEEGDREATAGVATATQEVGDVATAPPEAAGDEATATPEATGDVATATSHEVVGYVATATSLEVAGDVATATSHEVVGIVVTTSAIDPLDEGGEAVEEPEYAPISHWTARPWRRARRGLLYAVV